jgi:hypothetical protein
MGSYDSAIDLAARAMRNSSKGRQLQSLLRESMYTWRRQASFAEVRRHVSALPGIERQFRLEVGNINTGRYEVVWIVETSKEVTVFSNAYPARKLSRAKARRTDWDGLLQDLSALREATTCASALEVSDGSAYFGSFAVGSNLKKFAVYGIVTLPRSTNSERLYSQLSPCSEIILKTYELAQSALSQ